MCEALGGSHFLHLSILKGKILSLKISEFYDTFLQKAEVLCLLFYALGFVRYHFKTKPVSLKVTSLMKVDQSLYLYCSLQTLGHFSISKQE